MMDVKSEWDLTVFYSGLDDPLLKKDFNTSLDLAISFEKKYKGKLSDFEAKDFLTFFKDEEKIHKSMNKFILYLHFNNALDTQSNDLKKVTAEFRNVERQINSKLLFISQEMKNMGSDKLIDLSNHNILKGYKNYFVKKSERLKYILGSEAEDVLNNKSFYVLNLESLFNELSGSFVFEPVIDGVKQKLGLHQLLSLRDDVDSDLRREYYRALREKYSSKEIQIVFAKIYNGLVMDWTSNSKIRGYSSPISVRNVMNDLDDCVVDTLIDVVESYYFLYERFLKIKQKLLNKNKLMIWDLTAPNIKNSLKFSFEEAKNIFLASMKKFDDDFYNYSQDMFNGRVDVYSKPGKRTGAFTKSTKWAESYIMLNYDGNIDDLFTIAHEMGHAIHGKFCQERPFQVFNKSLSLSETASIFNEYVLADYLCEQLDESSKFELLENRLFEAFGSIFRQIQFTKFERRVYDEITKSNELSYVDLNIMWREELNKSYGGAVEFDVAPEKDSSWSVVKKFFLWPFYCYSYSFGNLLSLALYAKYKCEGDDFISNYKEILSSAGSKKPYDLLLEHGIDIKSKEFYENGLKVVEKMLDDFEEIALKHI